ncbi:hypothetical protein ACH5RR_005604 [Cinchona calisaya]|uniref:F-box domain-containing protein n=1 Tax=Cinchona calisaya TaxID=153742 RepID=A0ABD3ALX2_9GENT
MKILNDLIKYDHHHRDQKPESNNSRSSGKENPTTIQVNGIGNLPRDLFIEILARIPVKVLCQFRCVSKQWRHMLSHDKHFVARHSQQSKANPHLIFRKYYSNEVKEELDMSIVVELTSIDIKSHAVSKIRAPVGGPVNTFASCGPLVLMCCPYRIYVCNPGTKEIVRVPLSSSVARYCTVGFGQCSTSSCPIELFKIVHLFPNDSFVGDEGMGCEIFSLKNGTDVNLGSWKRTGDCPYKVQTHGLSVCVGGFAYWMVSDEANDLNNKAILSFDLENEIFESISYPKSCSDLDHNLLFLTGFKNQLTVVDSSAKTSVTDIWVMKDRKSKIWMKEYTFDLSSLGPFAGGDVKIRGVVPCDYEDGGIVIDTEQHGLIYYNMMTQIFAKIKTASEERYKLPCLYYDGFFSIGV